MSTTNHCRTCGTDVPAGAPFGHCPKCLIALGFGPLPEDVPLLESSDGKQRFGDYELVEQLGRGGMGVVYKARQVRLNRLVAIKMISSGEFASPALVQRFHREAEAAANLHHPNIVPIYEIGELRGQHFYSMQLVEGTGLDKHISRSGFTRGAMGKNADARTTLRARQEDIARILATVAHAVDYAHRHGVLHRDLKPGNILLDARGEPHLTDFGVAKVMGHEASNLTASGAIMGTPSYMAPEQAAGDSKHITVAADIYSLGAVLYTMLTGGPPFRAETPVETLRQVIEQEPRHPSTIREGLDFDLATIAMKCLEKEPQRRYASAAALAEDLGRWLHGEPIQARPVHPGERLWRWSRRNRAASAALALLVFGLAVSVALLRAVSSERDSKQRVVRILIKSISQSVERFADPSQPYILLTAEELAAFAGSDPREPPPRTRLSVGVLIAKNPLETTVAYARFLPVLERAMSGRLGEPMRIDLKIYRDAVTAHSELLAGRIDFAQRDRMLAENVSGDENQLGPIALLRETTRDYSTLIITRPDSGITNLAGLRGRTLGLWDRNSIFSLAARAHLGELGFCQSDVKCVYLNDSTESSRGVPKAYIEESPMSDYDRTGSTVPALLNGQFDAVVCPVWQLNVLKEGRDWRQLTAFTTTRPVWLGRGGLNLKVVRAFVAAMCEMRPSDHALLNDLTQSESSGHAELDKMFNQHFRETILRAAAFEQCRTNATATMQK